ncbi:MAG: hypothetical protein CMF49_01355 [Legionellales bacterium]|nr:hypothetical protein [Legionellales bacterium]|tara:strand:+ start:1019 stop:1285 length:267 start_codon:yes stop_codon:yes gene_type:complete
MSNDEISKLYWAARRGMLELDIFLMPFVKNVYQYLSHDEQVNFQAFLSCTDMELYYWLTEKEPAPAQYLDLVNRIIQYARDTAKSKRD